VAYLALPPIENAGPANERHLEMANGITGAEAPSSTSMISMLTLISVGGG
jgi:hypothetical protein